jgi:predicted small metal-binding protein
MDRLIRCECGFIARGESDEAVVAAIETHMSTDHPDVLARLDRSEIYNWIEQT